MTPTRETLLALADRLSDAQRDWIAAMPTIPTSLSPEDWDAMPPFYFDTPEGQRWFAHGKASYYGDGGPWMLSAQLNDTGLAIRATLTDHPVTSEEVGRE